MRLSRFWTLMTDEFGQAYADTLARGHVVQALGDRTAAAALDAGVPPRTVWEHLCEDLGIPEDRRLGVDREPVPVPPEIALERPE
ncbi:DUF3046 domain-containing protein [Janibacter cremeus]|uniref:DUF3046 domain-containing protein n=1 Tax=Janibacter cremeus TaxID=1285192 RepID=UPI0023F8C73B|nr:DUF3046 domain-containing protein [Janibacter cremeus]WEV79437.1 DUF3046 domain-containing protein [Janibacter cremeus]